MRDIKFRAWDIEKKEMLILGSPLFTNSGELVFHDYSIDHKESSQSFIDTNYASNQDRYKLMQYTGLRDKNGKEIYEGDLIVEKRFSFYVMPTEIKWDEYGWNIFGQMDFGHGAGGELRPEHCEVVGNIYENPELVKTK